MEIVLGVSMTPTTVSVALVEGEKADGAIIEHDVFDVSAPDGSGTSSGPDHVVAAIQGTQEGAFAAGHHLISTGVAWTDHADAARLREELVTHGIDDVLLASELHAAGALARAVGRAVGYAKTGLIFVEPETATLAVVETADGSVVKVLSQRLDSDDVIAGVTDMVLDLDFTESVAQALFVVGSAVDVTAVKSRLKDLVPVPVIVPEEPRLALARGAALAAASAPRYDTSTIGLAYSQDPDDTTAFLWHGDASADTIELAAAEETLKLRKPLLVTASSLIAIFVAGVTALAVAMVVSVRPTANQEVAAPVVPITPSPAPGPAPITPLPKPAPPGPPFSAATTARLMVPPPPPPPQRVIVQNAAPAPVAAPPPPPAAPPPPPPLVIPPVIPAPIVQWLPPILQVPQWGPGPGHGGGHGGGKHGHGGDGD